LRKVAVEEKGVEEERHGERSGIGEDEAECGGGAVEVAGLKMIGVGIPGGQGGEDEEENSGEEFHASGGGVSAQAAKHGGEVLIKREEREGHAAGEEESVSTEAKIKREEQDVAEEDPGIGAPDGIADPRRKGDEEDGDGDAGEGEAEPLAVEPGTEGAGAGVAEEGSGVAFGDVGGAEHDEGGEGVDEFKGGLVDAEGSFAGFAEEVGDEEGAEEGQGAGDHDPRDVGGGGVAGGGDGAEGEEVAWDHGGMLTERERLGREGMLNAEF
jgi:hypothetical protein